MNTIQMSKDKLLEASERYLARIPAIAESHRLGAIKEIEGAYHPFKYSKHYKIMCLQDAVENFIRKEEALHKQIQAACLVAEGLVIIDFETADKLFGE